MTSLAIPRRAVKPQRLPYHSYKRSGPQWLDALPSHWEWKRLKHLVSLVTSESRGWADYYTDEGPIFLRIGNLSRAGIDLDLRDLQRVNPPRDAEGSRTRVEPGDVLISVTAFIGSIGVVPRDLGEAYVNQHIALTRPLIKVVEPRWLAYCLLSHVGKYQFAMDLYGGTKDGLGLDDVRNLGIILPPPDEQRVVIRWLDRVTAKIDCLIAKKQRHIELLHEKRTSLISHAVTRGLDPGVPMRNSGIEWANLIPSGWKVLRNGNLFTDRDERGFPDLPILEVSIRTGCTERQFSDEHIEQRAEDPGTYKRASCGDIVFNKMRLWQGAVGVAPMDGLVSPDYTVARPCSGTHAEYYEYLFRSNIYMIEVNRYSHGIVKDRNRLYWDDFKQMPSLVPPLIEQVQIANEVRRITAKIDCLTTRVQHGIGRLQEYRTALISAAVTGKIDVRGEVE